MALKENLEAVKEGLNTEEQFLEKFIKGERFIKKYKFYLIALVIIAILWYAISAFSAYLNDKKIAATNEIYAKLMQNPSDEKALNELRDKNLNLYAIFLNERLQNEQNNTQISSELNEILKTNKLDKYLTNILALNLNEKSIFLKDYDKLLQAYELLKLGKISDANILLNQIQNDELAQIAKNLKHYQGIK